MSKKNMNRKKNQAKNSANTKSASSQDKKNDKKIHMDNKVDDDLKDNNKVMNNAGNKKKRIETDNSKIKEYSLIKKIAIVWIVIGIIIILLYVGNNKIDVTEHVYKTDKISKKLDGFTIVQISDLHNKEFGKNNRKLIAKVREARPDIIVITGDIIDFNKTNVDIAVNTAKRLSDIAVTYYVTGNHEYGINANSLDKLMKGLENAGVIIMQNRLEIINDNMCVIGLDEREIIGYGGEAYSKGTPKRTIESLIEAADVEKDKLKILLSHEPQIYKKYELCDIVFTGHAHGGQFRIPFVNKGFVAPDQGFFPKYTEGRHDYKGSTMYISRGLGNSIIPQRIFNNPEIVKVEINYKKDW